MLRELLRHFLELRMLYLVFIPGSMILGNIAMPLAGAFAFGFAIWMHLRGNYIVNIFAFLYMLHFGEIRHFEWTIFTFSANTKVVYSVALGLLVLYDISREKYHFNKIFIFLLPFFFASLFSLLNSPIKPTATLKTFSFFLTYFNALHYFFFYLVRETEFKRHLYWYFITLLGAGFLMMFLVPLQAFFGTGVRFRGVFGNPNGLGLFGMICIIFLMYYLALEKKSRMETFTVYSLAVLSVMFSGNKGNLFALFVFLGVFVLFNKKTRIWGIIMLFSVLMFLPLLDFETVSAVVRLLGLQEQLRLQSIYTGSGRYVAWEWALEWVAREPLIGRGFSFEELLFDKYLPIFLTMTGHQGGVHNSYLVFLLNTGIVGLFLVGIFFVKFFTAIPDRRYAVSLGVSFAVSIFFEGYGSSSLNYFAVLFVLLSVVLMADEFRLRQ